METNAEELKFVHSQPIPKTIKEKKILPYQLTSDKLQHQAPTNQLHVHNSPQIFLVL